MPTDRQTPTIGITLNGQTVHVPAGSTILDAASQAGVDIPTICYHPNLTANAVCRLCTVEVVGSRTLQPACVVPVRQDMVVNTETDACPHRAPGAPGTAGIDRGPARSAGDPGLHRAVRRRRGPLCRWRNARASTLMDDNPFYVRDYSQCVMCWRCIQVCAEDVQYTFALTWGGRGLDSHVATFFGEEMPDTTCVFCGNCVGVCPTGALKGKVEFELERTAVEVKRMKADSVVRSTCPYCGVGCQVLLNIKDERIFRVDAPFDAAPNYGRLCVKGRFGAGLSCTIPAA